MPLLDVAIVALASAWLVVIFIGAVIEHIRLRRDEWRAADRSEIRY
jgi:hypothetical protein